MDSYSRLDSIGRRITLLLERTTNERAVRVLMARKQRVNVLKAAQFRVTREAHVHAR